MSANPSFNTQATISDLAQSQPLLTREESSSKPTRAPWFHKKKIGPQIAFLMFAVLVSAPAWIVKHPPLEDLPFHLATERVLKSYRDPFFGFDSIYTLDFKNTQYLGYYFIVWILSHLVGVKAANIFMMCLYLGGTPLFLGRLLTNLGLDSRRAWFIVPLLPNILWSIGLLPFLSGVPLMFLNMSFYVEYIKRRSLWNALKLAFSSLLLFYMHVFPFGIFGIFCILLFPWKSVVRPLSFFSFTRLTAPLFPSLAALFYWALFTAPGRTAFGFSQKEKDPPVLPFGESLSQLWQWSGSTFRDSSDETLWSLLGLLSLVSLALSFRDKWSTEEKKIWPLMGLPLMCFVAYFNLPQSKGPVFWLYAQRFPVLGLFTLVLFLRLPKAGKAGLGQICFLSVIGLGLASTFNVCAHYIRFEQEEVGDIDEAITRIPNRKKVAALIFDKGSSIVEMAPFLHFGSYYQLEKGGLIQFSHVGYDHWPFKYKPGQSPQKGDRAELRWEWTPEKRNVETELYPHYDYILTRGHGFRPRSRFQSIWSGDRWQIWKRLEETPPEPPKPPTGDL